MVAGVAVGSFLDGVARGAALGRSFKQDEEERRDREEERKLRREQLEMARAREGRAARMDEHNIRVGEASFAELEEQRSRAREFEAERQQGWRRAEQTYGEAIDRQLYTDELKPAGPIPRGLPENVKLMAAVQGPTRPGFRVGSNTGQTFATREEAAAEAQRRYSVADHYIDSEAPKFREYLVSRGMTKEAGAWDEWVGSENVRQKIEILADADRAMRVGDYYSALGLIQHALNEPGYLDDGKTYGLRSVLDDAGNQVGIEGFIREDATGAVQRQTFRNPEEVFKAVWPLISPTSVFMKGLEDIGRTPNAERDFGVIGTDEFGNEQRGFIDRRAGTVEPARMVGRGGGGAAAGRGRRTPGGFELMEVLGEDGAPVLVRRDQWDDASRTDLNIFNPQTNFNTGRARPRAALRMPVVASSTASPPASAIPPAPAGVDPKTWRTEQTKRAVESAGMRPMTAEERAAYRVPDSSGAYMDGNKPVILGGGGTTVNVGKGETKEAEALGTERGKRAAALEAQADAAAQQISKLDLLEGLLQRATTGALAPHEQTIGGFIQAFGGDPATFGLNPNQPATGEAAQKIINEMMVGMIGSGGFPANNFSNADREFLLKIFPSMSNRPESNAVAVEMLRRIQEKTIEKAEAWGRFQEEAEREGRSASFGQFELRYRRELQKQNIFSDLAAMAGEVSKQGASSPRPAVPPTRRASGEPPGGRVPDPSPPSPGGFSREELEAEARRRGLIR